MLRNSAVASITAPSGWPITIACQPAPPGLLAPWQEGGWWCQVNVEALGEMAASRGAGAAGDRARR